MRVRLPLLIALATLFAVGCTHAQVPPVSNAVKLSWTAPATGCTTGCTYILSRITLASGTTTCPAASTTTPNYTPLNQASPTGATTYTDPTAGGSTACYIAQTALGNSISQPSGTAGPFVVPPNALAPGLVTGTETSAENVAPLPMPSGLVAFASPAGLGGHVGR